MKGKYCNPIQSVHRVSVKLYYFITVIGYSNTLFVKTTDNPSF